MSLYLFRRICCGDGELIWFYLEGDGDDGDWGGGKRIYWLCYFLILNGVGGIF